MWPMSRERDLQRPLGVANEKFGVGLNDRLIVGERIESEEIILSHAEKRPGPSKMNGRLESFKKAGLRSEAPGEYERANTLGMDLTDHLLRDGATAPSYLALWMVRQAAHGDELAESYKYVQALDYGHVLGTKTVFSDIQDVEIVFDYLGLPFDQVVSDEHLGDLALEIDALASSGGRQYSWSVLLGLIRQRNGRYEIPEQDIRNIVKALGYGGRFKD